MSINPDPLTEAQSNAQRMATHAEQSLVTDDSSEMQSQIQEALRYGEMARAFIEELLDSTGDERLMLHSEQALESIEEALDQASQALFSSEAAMREHAAIMSAHADQGMAQLVNAMSQEAA